MLKYTRDTTSDTKHHIICMYLCLLEYIICVIVWHAWEVCLFDWNGRKCSFPSGHVTMVYTARCDIMVFIIPHVKIFDLGWSRAID